MHIGLLTPEYATPRKMDGGLANYLRKTARALTARGHSVSIFLLSDRNQDWADEKISVHEIKQVAAPLWLKQRLYPFFPVVEQMLSARRLAARVWNLHAARPLDILQASSYLAPGYALRRNGRVPLVCRVSSYSPVLRSAEGRRRHQAEYLTDWLEIRQIIDADAAFAPSQFVADLLGRIEAFQPRVLRTTLDANAASPDDAIYQKHLAGRQYLLYFGALSRLKGADILAETLPALLENHQRLSVALIGRDDGLSGQPSAVECIRAACHKYTDRLIALPSLPAAQLLPIIAHARAVLMPSRADNYPNACLEAQAQGVPVIAFDQSSLEEMMSEGETGFLAPNGSAAGFQAAIERCLQQAPDARCAMRERILAQVARLNAEDRVGQLLEFYEATILRFKATKQLG